MNTQSGPQLDERFSRHLDERRPLAYTHGLVGHPLLTVEAVADLAEQLGGESISAEEAVKPLVNAVPDFQSLATDAIADRIRELAHSDSWFTLLNIEQSHGHRVLIDEILDAVATSTGLPPQSLRRRMGFVFASSPGSVTPAHFDIEHSLLMQLEGHRRLWFGDFPDPASREREVSRYWQGSFGRLESMPIERGEHHLEPGTGAYIPPYVPHWLQNGDTRSLSLTVTFFDRSNEDESLVQSFNERLRRFGLQPRAYGSAPRRDRAAATLMRAQSSVRRSFTPATPIRPR